MSLDGVYSWNIDIESRVIQRGEDPAEEDE